MPFLPAVLAFAQPITVTPGKIIQGLRPIAFASAPFGSKFVATMEDGTARIIDSRTRQTVRNLATHPGPAYAAAWSPNDLAVATGDETARIWLENPDNGQKIREYRTHTKGIEKLSFNLPGTSLLSTGKDDEIKIYDLTSPKPKEAEHILGHGLNFYGATFSPRAPYLFATGFLGIGGTRLYNALQGTVIGYFNGHSDQGVFDVAFSPDGTRLVTAGRDANAIVWDVKHYEKLQTLRGHGDWVNNVAFSPNGRLIATSSTDRTVKVWDARTFAKIADLDNQSSVGSPLCFTADGKNLITVTGEGYLQYNTVDPPQSEVGAPVRAQRPQHRPKRRHRGYAVSK